MDIGRAFGFVREDEQWLSKVLLGGVLQLIPIAGTFMVLGYTLRIARNVAQGAARPLPEWTDFGGLFKDGFYAFVITIVYLLPGILVVSLGSCISSVLIAAGGDEGGVLTLIGSLLSLVVVVVYMVLVLVGTLASYIGWSRYAISGELSDALKYREALAELRSNWLQLFVLLLLGGLLAMVGAIACFIGALFTGAYAQFALGHGIGQLAARRGEASGYSQSAPSSF